MEKRLTSFSMLTQRDITIQLNLAAASPLVFSKCASTSLPSTFTKVYQQMDASATSLEETIGLR